MSAQEAAVILILALIVLVTAAAYWRLKRSIPRLCDNAYTAGRESFRKDSQRTRRGNTVEQYVPFLDAFPYDPSDARFIGGPIDYVVFDGLAEGQVREVVFVEVKTSKRGLDERQKQVNDCVEAGAVDFFEFRVQDSTASARLKRPHSRVRVQPVLDLPGDETARQLGRPYDGKG
jgi:predicted Holliday junction resolvase-like endonuclease